MRHFFRYFIVAVAIGVAFHALRSIAVHGILNKTPSFSSFHLPSFSNGLTGKVEAASGDKGVWAEYYGPTTNLERVDAELLDHTSGSLDIAMYAFTDRLLADELLRAAQRGVHIRIYRDNQQFEEERGRNQYVAETLARSPNISIRVKGDRTLMHLKAWADATSLREGSANWSPSGEKRQDNSVVLFRDPASVEAFHLMFETMWQRRDNLIVQ